MPALGWSECMVYKGQAVNFSLIGYVVQVAAVALVATAAHVCWRAAITYGVGEEPRRW